MQNSYTVLAGDKLIVHLSSEAKRNGFQEPDKWFLEPPNEMIECESVAIVNMCEA